MSDEQSDQKPDFVGLPVETDIGDPSKEVSALNNNIARLEVSLDTEKEKRLEDRFMWVCFTALLLDIIDVTVMNGSWLFLPIFMLQLVVMIGFARKCGGNFYVLF